MGAKENISSKHSDVVVYVALHLDLLTVVAATGILEGRLWQRRVAYFLWGSTATVTTTLDDVVCSHITWIKSCSENLELDYVHRYRSNRHRENRVADA